LAGSVARTSAVGARMPEGGTLREEGTPGAGVLTKKKKTKLDLKSLLEKEKGKVKMVGGRKLGLEDFLSSL